MNAIKRTTPNNTDELHSENVEWKKPDQKYDILYDFTDVKFDNRQD